jgi:glycerol-3-phosphate acyltransferase PlsY
MIAICAFCFLLLLAFLIGSIPFAFILVWRIKRIDVRTVGSGNPGATNVARVLGKPMGFLVLFLDILKGAAPAWFFPLILQAPPFQSQIPVVLTVRGAELCMGLAAFLGHCYSPLLRFKGGKGVATALGVYLVVAPKATLLTLVVCVLIILTTRMISLASITGAVLLPAALLAFDWHGKASPWVPFGVTALLGAVVLFRHRSNIRRILAGRESKFT